MDKQFDVGESWSILTYALTGSRRSAWVMGWRLSVSEL